MLARSEAESVLSRPGVARPVLLEALRRLPEDVDPGLAAGVVVDLLEEPWPDQVATVREVGRGLPVTVIRAVVERCRSRGSARALFLAEAVDGPDVRGAWLAALEAMERVEGAEVWASRTRRAVLAQIATSPRFLRAVQTAVVGAADPSPHMLAVLATDGSEASVDALMVQFDRAVRTGRLDGLAGLARLRAHAARTPAMVAMIDAVDRQIRERHAASPAMGLARAAGLEVDRLVVDVWLDSTPGRLTFHGHLALDSTQEDCVRVRVVGPGGVQTRWSTARAGPDDLGLGRCAPEDLPGWLALAQHRLGTRWSGDRVLHGSLRHAERDRFLGWLLGPSTEGAGRP